MYFFFFCLREDLIFVERREWSFTCEIYCFSTFRVGGEGISVFFFMSKGGSIKNIDSGEQGQAFVPEIKYKTLLLPCPPQ